jgi:hypothetical protein
MKIHLQRFLLILLLPFFAKAQTIVPLLKNKNMKPGFFNFYCGKNMVANRQT